MRGVLIVHGDNGEIESRTEMVMMRRAPNSDLLLGGEAIGQFLGVGRTWLYKLMRSDDALPTFKVGKTVVARKSSLVKWMQSRRTNRRYRARLEGAA